MGKIYERVFTTLDFTVIFTGNLLALLQYLTLCSHPTFLVSNCLIFYHHVHKSILHTPHVVSFYTDCL
jgi:hypothetical protein